METVGEIKGLFTLIPDLGYQGWVCTWGVDEKYSCRSKYFPITEYKVDRPVDLSRDKFDQLNWFCDVE